MNKMGFIIEGLWVQFDDLIPLIFDPSYCRMGINLIINLVRTSQYVLTSPKCLQFAGRISVYVLSM